MMTSGERMVSSLSLQRNKKEGDISLGRLQVCRNIKLTFGSKTIENYALLKLPMFFKLKMDIIGPIEHAQAKPIITSRDTAAYMLRGRSSFLGIFLLCLSLFLTTKRP